MEFFSKWWIYQKERFPVFAHGTLIAAFSFSALSYSYMLRDGEGWIGTVQVCVAFLTCFMFFLQLRIADEFKDFDDDFRYRPYRPVPRGLITLKELGWLGVITALIQLLLSFFLGMKFVFILLVVWVYLALMSKEFFVGEWLKAHPITYMLSHMIIMPMIDLYATACDWLEPLGSPPDGLHWFLIVSYFNGIVIEIGRKVRSPEDEEEGVDTYSFLWGRVQATYIWLGAVVLTALFAWIGAVRIGYGLPVLIVLLILLLAASVISAIFVNKPLPGRGRWIEHFSGVWTLLMYLSLGAAPYVHSLLK